MKTISTILLALAFTILNAQDIVVSGYVKNKITDEVLKNVNVKVENTNYGTATNNNGFYKITIPKSSGILVFTHIAYYDKIVQIRGENVQQLNILLEPKVTELGSVSINANKIINIVQDKPLYVKDYEFYDDNILMLVYEHKKLSKPSLVLITPDGDTLSSKPVYKSERLFKDCLEKNHLLTKNYAYEVIAGKSDIALDYLMEKEEFEAQNLPVVEAIDNLLFWKQYYYSDQIIVYYSYDFATNKSKEFKVIMNERGMYMLKDKARLLKDATDAEIRFEEMIMYKPIFAPLVKLHDSICILNYVDSKIEFYTSGGELLGETPISYHLDKQWKNEIYIDEIKGKIYAMFKQNGISKLREINLKEGILDKEIDIPGYQFVENIKVRDDVVYFLYKENFSDDYKQLYKMKI
ncbi:MAG: carboxypeptidase-like regulatory domain-containing protein [Saprospiraceae bacterium]|nr:carboxypeptidase-like regulatory domain-containing protein [Saprospiraceae bacterium]